MSFIVFFIIVSLLIYYICFIFNKKLPIIQILMFNLILYLFVGVIEYIFFTQIASKYVPITNNDILIVIKNYFLKILFK